MMNKHRLSTLILVILLLSGVVTAVVINIDGSNLTPLSWFNSNKTAWDGNDTYFNYTFLSEKLLAGSSVTVTCYANGSCSIASTASGTGNASYPLNVSNATGVLPNASIPASAMNVSQTRSVVISYTRDTTLTGVQALTGAGFRPTYVEIWAAMNGKDSASWGKFDGTTMKTLYQTAGAFYAGSANIVQLFNSSLEVHANAAVFTDDGMNITWAGDSPIGTAAMDVTFWR